MNPRAGAADLLVFEARPFSHLGTPPFMRTRSKRLSLFEIVANVARSIIANFLCSVKENPKSEFYYGQSLMKKVFFPLRFASYNARSAKSMQRASCCPGALMRQIPILQWTSWCIS